ncbi:MAG TPA: dCTP deaminase [Caulobacteraceae bacterium]|jgi:dCTP deaminase
MMSDAEIVRQLRLGELVIEGFHAQSLRASSYMLRLSSQIAVLSRAADVVDLADSSTYPSLVCMDIEKKPYMLRAGEFVLGGTIEKIGLSRQISATLLNLSGLSRLGLFTEIASLVSPGFGSSTPMPLTLEIKNFAKHNVRLVSGMPVCHLVFWKLTGRASESYDEDHGRHSSEVAPSGSRYYMHFRHLIGQGDG